jgi:hypothetical protein
VRKFYSPLLDVFNANNSGVWNAGKNIRISKESIEILDKDFPADFMRHFA